jgi:hypothetical protein
MAAIACPHECCSVECPKDSVVNAQRWIDLHARRFKQHNLNDPNCQECIDNMPFPHDHHTCKKCLELIDKGEWTHHSGGYDSMQCRHSGCNYFSVCPRTGNRNQAIERHELSPHMHAMHIELHGDDCKLCKQLLASNEWQDNMQVQTSMRLKSKEMFNAITFGAVVKSVKKRKRKIKTLKKIRKRKKGL